MIPAVYVFSWHSYFRSQTGEWHQSVPAVTVVVVVSRTCTVSIECMELLCLFINIVLINTFHTSNQFISYKY